MGLIHRNINVLNGASSQEEAIRIRYAEGARDKVEELCCPINYDPRYLDMIPAEIRERDYGCGDPTAYVRPGDVVLDLGSGGGKSCYIAAQIVGPGGKVVGVDCNAEMLALARRHRAEVAQRLGYCNVEFRCGLIQDLRLDLDVLGGELHRQPVIDQASWLRARSIEQRLRLEQPMIADETIDCVISNCVLNLVRPDDRNQLFAEIYRVLKLGGRAAISDIVCDEDVPAHLQRKAELWSGCISGAYREDLFVKAFEEAGFHGVQIDRRQQEAWRTVEGIEFRSVTILAYKVKQGPCLERNQAVIYRGPFKKVEDDDGHAFYRGERTAVCDKTFQLLQHEPYNGSFIPLEPLDLVPPEDAEPFECRHSRRRDPRETKGVDYNLTTETVRDCCGPGSECC